MRILCPYCLSEITEETIICMHCNQDTRNDAAFEMTDEEIIDLELHPCKFCNKPIPKLSIFCKHCKMKKNNF